MLQESTKEGKSERGVTRLSDVFQYISWCFSGFLDGSRSFFRTSYMLWVVYGTFRGIPRGVPSHFRGLEGASVDSKEILWGFKKGFVRGLKAFQCQFEPYLRDR